MHTVKDRKETILLDLVTEYIETAQPVSSGELLSKHNYKLSSATIRNVMAELTEQGYLDQPHTSAGRVPTKKAYRFFVDKMELSSEGIKNPAYKKLQQEMQGAMQRSPASASQLLAQRLAELSGSLAFVGLMGLNRIYKEGLMQLLEEPEFTEAENIRSLLAYTEHLENRIEELCNEVQGDVCITIGENQLPFSFMAFSHELPNQERGIFGLVGPMRMHYAENLMLLDSIRELFDELHYYGQKRTITVQFLLPLG